MSTVVLACFGVVTLSVVLYAVYRRVMSIADESENIAQAWSEGRETAIKQGEQDG